MYRTKQFLGDGIQEISVKSRFQRRADRRQFRAGNFNNSHFG